MFKRISMTVLMIAFLMVLSGCNNSPEKFTLELYWHDGSSDSHAVINNLDREEFALPFLEREAMQFVGWDDGENIYVDSYIVTSDMVLSAVFEDDDDVFEFEYNEDSDDLSLSNYTGLAKRITIPEQYNGHYLNGISVHAFKDSDILSVKIPMTVTSIASYAFEDAKDLQEVSWYGSPHGLETETSVFPIHLDEELSEYRDVCEIASVDGLRIMYESGCPIVETLQSASVFVGDDEYFTFTVTYDLEFIPEKQKQLIKEFAFKGALSLESFEIPAGLMANTLNGGVLQDAPLLKYIYVDEANKNYTVLDGVLYSKDMDTLYYYPNGLNDSTFITPDSVSMIGPYAFYQNEALEEIVISKNIAGIYRSFIGMSGLERFVVDEDNETYYTQDGVLFAYMAQDILMSYPGGKLDEVYHIPEGTEVINSFAFAYNNHLSDVVINQDIQVLESYVFSHATMIDILEIPGSVQKIERGIIRNSQIHTVIIRSDSTLNIPDESYAFSIEHFYDTTERPFTYADVYISDDIYDDYIMSNTLFDIMEFYHRLSDYQEE